ncbi:ribosome silencing factor [Tissierella sp.]|uniref:ribosome silencing factor n=1 Tax=Tissierella sp. TaxID=41274 RepID=UPI0037DBFC44
MELENKLSIITKACEDKKGIDIKVLNIGKLTPIADYFVIVSGNSSSQVQAIADEVESKVLEAGNEEEVSKEGYRNGRWILLDFNDIIVHVFHKEDRDFYNLERLWSDNGERDKLV